MSRSKALWICLLLSLCCRAEVLWEEGFNNLTYISNDTVVLNPSDSLSLYYFSLDVVTITCETGLKVRQPCDLRGSSGGNYVQLYSRNRFCVGGLRTEGYKDFVLELNLWHSDNKGHLIIDYSLDGNWWIPVGYEQIYHYRSWTHNVIPLHLPQAERCWLRLRPDYTTGSSSISDAILIDDVCLTATPAPVYPVTWIADEDTLLVDTYTQGERLVQPRGVENRPCALSNYRFIGWSTHPLVAGETPDTVYNFTHQFPQAQGPMTMYAVYAHSMNRSTWREITDSTDLTAGWYVFGVVNTSNGTFKALPSYDSNSSGLPLTDMPVENDTLPSVANRFMWHFTASPYGIGFQIQDINNYWLEATGDDYLELNRYNLLKTVSADPVYAWRIESNPTNGWLFVQCAVFYSFRALTNTMTYQYQSYLYSAPRTTVPNSGATFRLFKRFDRYENMTTLQAGHPKPTYPALSIAQWKTDSVFVFAPQETVTAFQLSFGANAPVEIQGALQADGTIGLPFPSQTHQGEIFTLTGIRTTGLPTAIDTLAQCQNRVPIVLSQNATTADPCFQNLADTVLAKTDVVVRDGATLTLSPDATITLHDLILYPTASCNSLPNSQLTLSSLVMRRGENDTIGTLSFQGDLTATSPHPWQIELFITPQNWHFVALPFEAQQAEMQIIGPHDQAYLLQYNGAHRASTQIATGNWDTLTNATLSPGVGYAIGLDEDDCSISSKSLIRFSATSAEALAQAKADKTVPVFAFGANSATSPAHQGWNLVGSPLPAPYTPAGSTPLEGLPLSGTTLPFLTIPIQSGWGGYQQLLASETVLQPTQAFFVQVGPTGATDGQAYDLTFALPNDSAPARLAPKREIAPETPIVLTLTLQSETEQDQTTLLLGNGFEPTYQIGCDLAKFDPSSPALSLYTLPDDGIERAFTALPLQSLSLPLGLYFPTAGTYTLSLGPVPNAFDGTIALQDNDNGLIHSLQNQAYTFTAVQGACNQRFTLSVSYAAEVVTAQNSAVLPEPTLLQNDRLITLSHLPEGATLQLFDAAGQLVLALTASSTEQTLLLPEAGAYFLHLNNGPVWHLITL